MIGFLLMDYILFIFESIDVLFMSIIVIHLIACWIHPLYKMILEIAIYVDSIYTPYVDVYYLLDGWDFLGILAL